MGNKNRNYSSVSEIDTFAEQAGIRENTMADIKSVIAENRVDI